MSENYNSSQKNLSPVFFFLFTSLSPLFGVVSSSVSSLFIVTLIMQTSLMNRGIFVVWIIVTHGQKIMAGFLTISASILSA